MATRTNLLVFLSSLFYCTAAAAAASPVTSDLDANTTVLKEDDLILVASTSGSSADKEVISLAISSTPKSPLYVPQFGVWTQICVTTSAAPPPDDKGKGVVIEKSPKKRRRNRGKKHKDKSVTLTQVPSAATQEVLFVEKVIILDFILKRQLFAKKKRKRKRKLVLKLIFLCYCNDIFMLLLDIIN